jgi:hypothetical protein
MLAISTFPLDLTMERMQPEGGGGPDDKSVSLSLLSSLPSLSWESVDSTIQSAAMGHLALVYALELDATPTQVLLTVISADPDDPGEGSGSGSGIIVRRSFRGGGSIPAPWMDADKMGLVALRNAPIEMADTSYGWFLETQKRDAERAYQRMDAEERKAFLRRLTEIDADGTKDG